MSLLYPPTTIDSVVTDDQGGFQASISGQVYGNGVYKIKVSSTYDMELDAHPNCCGQWSLFRYVIPEYHTAHWKTFNYINRGFFSGPNSQQYTLDGTYYGDWVWIELPEPIYMTGFKLIGRGAVMGRSPMIYRVYGSIDGVVWEVVHNQVTSQVYNDAMEAHVDALSTVPYRFFALVVQQVQASESLLNFVGWRIYGTSQVWSSNPCC